MVMKLPDVIPPPPPGPKEEVVEIPSTTNYYDGGAKLNKITINCKIYTSASNCLTNSHCGNEYLNVRMVRIKQWMCFRN